MKSRQYAIIKLIPPIDDYHYLLLIPDNNNFIIYSAYGSKYIKPYSWIIIKLKEGKNREIRKICEHFSWNISKLIRIQFGPYKLLNLKKGQIVEIKKII